MAMTYARASRLASICHKEFDFQFFVFQQEVEYKTWITWNRMVTWINRVSDNTAWNILICLAALTAIISVGIEISIDESSSTFLQGVFDIVYNVLYGVYVLALLIQYVRNKNLGQSHLVKLGYVVDVISYVHYVAQYLYTIKTLTKRYYLDIKTCFYYLRLHRPLTYLWTLTERNLSGSVVGNVLKCIYVFCLLRVTFALVLIQLIWYERAQTVEVSDKILNLTKNLMYKRHNEEFDKHPFFWCIYLVNKMFIPVGPQVYPMNDLERALSLTVMVAAIASMAIVLWVALLPEESYYTNGRCCPFFGIVYPMNDLERALSLTVMVSGTLLATGTAIASMAIVLWVALLPEESYRARFRLIMSDMEDRRVPKVLRSRVETFYRMYWHKQRGVSGAKLLEHFPPTTDNLIFSEIYFEAQQRSRILRDLSNQFLTELAKVMTTINYIPGDSIIKRKAHKSSIIYITYGDIEIMTAEDDLTPIMRFSRGTVVNGCGALPASGCAPSHVEIRAATFCTAHVLHAADLWKIVAKFGKTNGQAFIILSSFEEHFERVQRHYAARNHPTVKNKSSILFMKRNLSELKKARDPITGKLLLGRVDVFLEIAGAYVMRNHEEDSLTQQYDRICLRSTFPCILQPASTLIVMWSTFIAVLTFVISLTHPYYLVMKTSIGAGFRFFDYLVSVMFILDIIVQLSTGAKTEEGVPISFKKTAIQQVISIWMGLDVLAVLPILEFVGDGWFTGINKLFKLPKFFKTLKDMESVAMYYANALRFLSYTLLLFLTSYLLACFKQGFMCFQFKHCEVSIISEVPYWSERPLSNDTVGLRLYFAFHWAISLAWFSMHKDAQWGAELWQNRVFTMVVMEFCILLRIVIESVYAATIMVNSHMKQEYNSCIAKVKSFLEKNNMDPVLQDRFISYLQLCWHTDKAYSITHNKQPLLFNLPPHVANELLYQQRSKYIMGLLFSKYLSEKEMTFISSRARLFYSSPNEILLATGEVCNEVYVLTQGICEVWNPDTKKVVKTITVKDSFGVLECLLRFNVFYTVRAVTHVQVLSIRLKHLQGILSLPRFKDAINFAKGKKLYQNLLNSRLPFLSYTYPPPIGNRSLFPLPRKHEPDTAFSAPFNKLGFLSVMRYVFPRWTIRPDGKYLQRYEYFRGFCAFAGVFVFPNYAYLYAQFPWLANIAFFLDLAAYLDIIQRTLVGFYNERGLLVSHPASTAIHYLKTAFIVDLIACLPMEGLDTGATKLFSMKNMYMVPPMTQYLMFNRLLQLYRLPSALNRLGHYIEREDILLIIKGMPLLLALLNVMASVLFFESVRIFTPDEGGKWYFQLMERERESWIYKSQRYFDFEVLKSPLNAHLVCYFWGTYESTATGYNIFDPSNQTLLAVLCYGCIIGRMVITYLSVRVISIRSKVNTAVANFQEHMNNIKTFMIKEKLSKELKKEVTDYYTYTWDKMGGTDYRTVLKMCDQITLRTDAILYIYGTTFNKCPILLHSDVSLLRLIGRAVHSVYFIADTRFIERDDVIQDIYIVDYGMVEIKDSQDENSVVTKLPRGSIFGNLEPSKSTRSPNTFVASSNVHLLKINTDTFYKIIDEFPTTCRLLAKYRILNDNYIIGGLKDPSRNMSLWKERTFSMAVLIGTHHGLFKHLDIQHSFLMQYYLITICLVCVILDIYNPVFQDNRTPLVIILYILDLLFMIKILINFTLANSAVDTEVKLNLLSARRKYYKGALKFDILSIIPFELLCFLAEDQWYAFAFLRLNRVARAITINECLKLHQQNLDTNLVLATVVELSIWFVVMVHLTTCAWYYIGVMEDLRRTNSSWLYTRNDVPPCQGKYICSLYFTLTTFTHDGVGDILPRTQLEIIYVCILQILSTMLYTIYVGEFCNIIKYHSFRFFDYYQKYVELIDYLRLSCVSKNIIAMMKRYSLHLWRENRGVQMPYFLEIAPQCLHTKLMNGAYLHHLTRHFMFKNCEATFNRQLVRYFKAYTYDDAMYVVKENEITDSMYMVHSGTVEEIAEDLEEQIQLLKVGTTFGFSQGLQHNMPFTNSYRALGKAQVLTLCLNDWEYLLEHFPLTKSIIYKDKGEDDDDKEKERKHVTLFQQPSSKKPYDLEEGTDIAAGDTFYPTPRATKTEQNLKKGEEKQTKPTLTDHLYPEPRKRSKSFDKKSPSADASETLHLEPRKRSVSIRSTDQQSKKKQETQSPSLNNILEGASAVPVKKKETEQKFSLWPTDSRRQTVTEDELEKKQEEFSDTPLESSPPEREFSESNKSGVSSTQAGLSMSRRKSNVFSIDRAAIQAELDALEANEPVEKEMKKEEETNEETLSPSSKDGEKPPEKISSIYKPQIEIRQPFEKEFRQSLEEKPLMKDDDLENGEEKMLQEVNLHTEEKMITKRSDEMENSNSDTHERIELFVNRLQPKESTTNLSPRESKEERHKASPVDLLEKDGEKISEPKKSIVEEPLEDEHDDLFEGKTLAKDDGHRSNENNLLRFEVGVKGAGEDDEEEFTPHSRRRMSTVFAIDRDAIQAELDAIEAEEEEEKMLQEGNLHTEEQTITKGSDEMQKSYIDTHKQIASFVKRIQSSTNLSPRESNEERRKACPVDLLGKDEEKTSEPKKSSVGQPLEDEHDDLFEGKILIKNDGLRSAENSLIRFEVGVKGAGEDDEEEFMLHSRRRMSTVFAIDRDAIQAELDAIEAEEEEEKMLQEVDLHTEEQTITKGSDEIQKSYTDTHERIASFVKRIQSSTKLSSLKSKEENRKTSPVDLSKKGEGKGLDQKNIYAEEPLEDEHDDLFEGKTLIKNDGLRSAESSLLRFEVGVKGASEDDEEEFTPHSRRRKSTVFAIDRDAIQAELDAIEAEEEEEKMLREANIDTDGKMISEDTEDIVESMPEETSDSIQREEMLKKVPLSPAKKTTITFYGVDLTENLSNDTHTFEEKPQTEDDLPKNVESHSFQDGDDDVKERDSTQQNSRRKSNVFATDRDPIQAELDEIDAEEEEEKMSQGINLDFEDKSQPPKTSRIAKFMKNMHVIEEKQNQDILSLESKAKKPVKKTTFKPPPGPKLEDDGVAIDELAISRWPLNSRHSFSAESLISGNVDDKELEELLPSTRASIGPSASSLRFQVVDDNEEGKYSSSSRKRKSTVFAVDRDAIQAELDAIEAEENEEEMLRHELSQTSTAAQEQNEPLTEHTSIKKPKEDTLKQPKIQGAYVPLTRPKKDNELVFSPPPGPGLSEPLRIDDEDVSAINWPRNSQRHSDDEILLDPNPDPEFIGAETYKKKEGSVPRFDTVSDNEEDEDTTSQPSSYRRLIQKELDDLQAEEEEEEMLKAAGVDVGAGFQDT